MADVKAFIIDGVTYTVKDETARASAQSAVQKNTEQDSKITTLEGKVEQLETAEPYKPTYASEAITLSNNG